MNFEPIGYLQSCYPDKFGTPRQPGLAQYSWARLNLDRRWQPEESLQGIEAFSHLWLIWVFHKNTNERFHSKVHPPRLGGESMGLFATRSPHRPNPIGLSLVKLVRREQGSLIVSGVDLIDGTPILDLKPYLPEVESKPDATAGWTSNVDPVAVSVEWEPADLASLETWSAQLRAQGLGIELSPDQLRNLIEETLALDPRPEVYKGFEGLTEGSKYRQNHAVRFFNGDIHFQFRSPSQIQIVKLLIS